MANEKITKFNLETKLTEANYSLWYFQMAILLESAGCTLLDPEGNSIFLEGNAEVAEFVDKALGVLHSTIIASGRDQISLTGPSFIRMLWVRFPPTTGLGMKALPSRTIKFRNLVGAAVVRKV